MVGVVATAVAEIDPPGEGDVLRRVLVMPQDDELLVVAAHPAHPLVQDHLPTAVLDLGVEGAVGLLVQLQAIHVRAPDQPAHAHAPLDRVGEELRDRGALVAQQLIGITPPVGEEQVIPGVQRMHLLDQPVEVGAAVHQRLGQVPRRPCRKLRGRVAPLVRAEQPLLR
jgi:hypothetical protein